MATGDANDMAARLRAVLPSEWFPAGPLPVLDTLLAGFGTALAWAYNFLAFARAQMRLVSSTGAFLDLFAFDFFGNGLLRRPGETDAAYGARISASLLAPKNTRAAVIEAVTLLTGRAPVVFEPWRPADCGGLNVGSLALGGAGFGGAGALGNIAALPCQSFITAFRPHGVGVAYVMGLGGAGITTATGGLGQGLFGLVAAGAGSSLITDADIYAAIAATISEGTVAWTKITN
jgi:hypothetical protein